MIMIHLDRSVCRFVAVFVYAIFFLSLIGTPVAGQSKVARLIDRSASELFEKESNIRLCDAISGDDREEIRQLIASRIELNDAEENGMTVLLWALMEGNLNAFETLLENGADPHSVLKIDLHSPPFAKVQFDYFSGYSVLLSILQHPYYRRHFFSVAMKYIQEPDQRGPDGTTLMHNQVAINSVSDLRQPDLMVLKRMGVNMDATNQAGMTACRLAFQNSNPHETRGVWNSLALIKMGANTEIPSRDGTKLIDDVVEQNARKFGHSEKLDAFIAALSVQKSDKEAFDAFVLKTCPLLYWKADFLEFQAVGHHGELRAAIKSNDNTRVKQMVETGIDLNRQGPTGMTLLHAAYYDGNFEAFQLLLDGGASPDFPITATTNYISLERMCARTFFPQEGETVLMAACMNPFARPGYFEAALRCTKSPNLVDAFGRNILHLFLFYPRDDERPLLNQIIGTGIDPNAKSNSGATACHIAANMNPELIRVLVEAGANAKLQNGRGETVLQTLSKKKFPTASHKRISDWLSKQ